MKNKDLNSKKEKLEDTLCFPMCLPTEEQEKEILARVAEIGLRTIFENFCYAFGGEKYQQSSGGPIGARVTMAAARIVMQDFGEQWRISLECAKVEIGLLSGFVDDVSQGGTSIRLGLRFATDKKEWIWKKEYLVEDLAKRENGETRNRRMKRICLPAINSINEDLVFTGVTPENFANMRMPTLDFEFWLEENGEINHNYYQKPMKTPYVIMKSSAISQHQKISILSNEVVRGMSNINDDKISLEEKYATVEQLIKEMKVSGYDRGEIREVVVCGLTGWKRKLERRKETGMYRSAKSTLVGRCRRKLLAKTSWYKKKRKRDEEDEKEERENHGKRRKNENEIKEEKEERKEESKSCSVCPLH